MKYIFKSQGDKIAGNKNFEMVMDDNVYQWGGGGG